MFGSSLSYNNLDFHLIYHLSNIFFNDGIPNREIRLHDAAILWNCMHDAATPLQVDIGEQVH